MSDSKTIKLCNDKWKFYNKVKDDFNIPYTWQDNDIKWNGCFARPRYELGGSRGTLHCKDIHQYMSEHGKILVFLGEGLHKIKKKAEQVACEEAIQKLNTF